MQKLSPKAFGLAFGIVWGGAVLIMGIVALFSSWAQPFVNAVASLYVGYSASVLGIFVGTLWAFVDAYIGGWLVAWLYNKFI